MTELELVTSTRIQALDITDLIRGRVPAGPALLWVSTPHTTAALILCEADAEMLADIETAAGGLVAPLEPLTHHRNDNPNSAAHLMSSLFGSQLVLRVAAGELALGGYQRIVFVELDGPKRRTVQLEALPVLGSESASELPR